MKKVTVDQTIIENVIRYCEDKQVYDKLGAYGDFYYKLQLRMASQSITDNLEEHSKQFEAKETLPVCSIDFFKENLGNEVSRYNAKHEFVETVTVVEENIWNLFESQSLKTTKYGEVFYYKPYNVQDEKENWVIRINYPVGSGYFVSEAKGVLTTTEKKENATTFNREDVDSMCEGLNGNREEWFSFEKI